VVREKPCTDCTIGQYNAGTGWLSSSNSQGCKECPRGQYMPPERIPRTQCSMCAKGKSQSVSGQTRCDECASGQVQDTEGRETCKNCTAGHFSADQAGRSCTPCAPGQYMGGEGAHSCEPCAKNHATDQSGASKCQKCQDDESTQDQTGYTGCVKKKSGMQGRRVLRHAIELLPSVPCREIPGNGTAGRLVVPGLSHRAFQL
jgi:hypothetical protein